MLGGWAKHEDNSLINVNEVLKELRTGHVLGMLIFSNFMSWFVIWLVCATAHLVIVKSFLNINRITENSLVPLTLLQHCNNIWEMMVRCYNFIQMILTSSVILTVYWVPNWDLEKWIESNHPLLCRRPANDERRLRCWGGDSPPSHHSPPQGELLWPGRWEQSGVPEGEKYGAWPSTGLQHDGTEEEGLHDTTEPGQWDKHSFPRTV